jgi:hypothetical protein
MASKKIKPNRSREWSVGFQQMGELLISDVKILSTTACGKETVYY